MSSAVDFTFGSPDVSLGFFDFVFGFGDFGASLALNFAFGLVSALLAAATLVEIVDFRVTVADDAEEVDCILVVVVVFPLLSSLTFNFETSLETFSTVLAFADDVDEVFATFSSLENDIGSEDGRGKAQKNV